MEITLTIHSLAALAGVMLLGALVPGVSVLTVSARSISCGFSHGLLVTAGIITGDILFILIAIYGLSFLSGVMGEHFYLVKYLGGGYLIWLGLTLLMARPSTGEKHEAGRASLAASYTSGLLITLADQKAILFYLGLFPAFLDLETMTHLDSLLLILLAIIAVGVPKLVYAWSADRAGSLLQNGRAMRIINMIAAIVMVSVGVVVIVKA